MKPNFKLAKQLLKNTPDESSDFLAIKSGTLNTIVIKESHILRYTPSDLRSPKMVSDEIEFIKFLAERIPKVVKVLLQKSGQLVSEILVDGKSYSLVKFEKLTGRLLSETQITEEQIQEVGKIAGLIHKFSEEFSVKHSNSRYKWQDEKWVAARNELLNDDQELLSSVNKIIDKLNSLKLTQILIHNDMNRSNFMVEKSGNLRIFDFDDSQWGYPGMDLAATVENFLFFEHLNKETIRENYLLGYSQHTRLDLKNFDLYFSYRQMLVYLFMKTIPSETLNLDFKKTLINYRADLINSAF